jgi:carbonic anhydrase
MPFNKLIQGFGRFHSKYFLEKNKLFENLVQKGQSPEVLMIACSDSRNDPALITECEPGDIFVVRNVAAIVPPYSPDDKYHGTSAAIEFAIKGLKVKDIVIMGHALCGGVAALLNGTNKTEYEFLDNWIEIGNAAKNAVQSQLSDAPEAS